MVLQILTAGDLMRKLYNAFDTMIDHLDEAKLPAVAQKLRRIRDDDLPSFRVAIIDYDGSGAVYDLTGGDDPAGFTPEEIERDGRLVCAFCDHRRSNE
jgi:hypothetical protein